MPPDTNRSCGRKAGGLLPIMSEEAPRPLQSDWIRRPGAALIWWCVPVGLALVFSLAIHRRRVVACAWMIALAWMGIGCLLNALRCHRLHCFISAPILLLGALAVGLIGFDVVALGPHALNNTISSVLLLAVFSFLPEIIRGQYRDRNHSGHTRR